MACCRAPYVWNLPSWSSKGHICRDDLNTYRRRYVEDLLKHERGELTLDSEVGKGTTVTVTLPAHRVL